MANMKWTDAQHTAIFDRGGSLLVSAAAGSGKTAVLTERVVELLRDAAHPIAADRLLIVTFTNAAAAELRARIAARLEQTICQNPSEARLRRQKMLLQRANICTIDAFCLHLLQRHFTALDIPPDFALADAGVVGRLKSQALAQTLEEAYLNPDFCAFADLYGKGRSDGAASAAILLLYDFLRTLPFGEAVKEMALSAWQPENTEARADWYAVLQQQARVYIENGLRFAYSARTLCEEDFEQAVAEAIESKKTPATQDKAAAKVKGKYNDLFRCVDDLIDAFTAAKPWAQEVRDWDTLYEILDWHRSGALPMPGLKNTGIRLSGANRARVKRELDQAAEWYGHLLQLVPCTVEEMGQDCALAHPMLEAFFDAEARFAQLFYDKKLEKKMLEFADLEHLALALLAENDGVRTPLAASISAQFDAVMVDEYQDTNALQETLYRRLANEAGDNLFFVGDLKQSIYRFRQADPSIFAEKLSRFAPLAPDAPRLIPTGQGTDALLTLDANFRSTPAVVEGVNFLFEQVMQGGLGGVEYGDGQRLVCGVGDAVPGQVGLLIDADGGRDAEQIALKIKELIALGAAGNVAGMVRDGGTLRPVRPEDCCILLSTRAPFTSYADALQAQGLASYADAAEDLLSTRHIRPLVALLQIIDNPAQDIPLAAAMRSMLFSFTDDDLLALRARQPKGSLYGVLVQVANQARAAYIVKADAGDVFGGAAQGTVAGIDPFAQKILYFYETLSALRRLSHTLSPEELIAEIFTQTHYLALVGAMEQGTRRRQEVRKFVSYAVAAGVNGIEALVHNIEQTKASGGLVDSAPGRVKAGCVTIMTIHRSKGLQFPVVFAANLHHRFNTDDLKHKILLHRNHGIGLQLRAGEQGNNYHTVASLALREVTKQELRSEELRLLYVMLTRAQDMLYMTGSAKGYEKNIPAYASAIESGTQQILCNEATCFLHWVLLGYLRHPSCGMLRADLGGACVGLCDVKYHMQVQILRADETEDAAENEQALLEEALPTPEPATVAALCEGFAWQYPRAALTELPAKVSVTALVHKEQGTILERPAFLSKDGMTAAEKGTALHSFLEHADFDVLKRAQLGGAACLKDALRAEQIRQEKEQRILPEIAQRLDMTSVETFFEGEAFARIAGASEVYREYAFITGLPADEVLASDGQHAAQRGLNQIEQVQDATVLVQGIADVVLVYPDHLELLDYKSDHGKNEENYRKSYAKQLGYYAKAIEKRFAPLKITYKAIYSFDLGRLIVVE